MDTEILTLAPNVPSTISLGSVIRFTHVFAKEIQPFLSPAVELIFHTIPPEFVPDRPPQPFPVQEGANQQFAPGHSPYELDARSTQEFEEQEQRARELWFQQNQPQTLQLQADVIQMPGDDEIVVQATVLARANFNPSPIQQGVYHLQGNVKFFNQIPFGTPPSVVLGTDVIEKLSQFQVQVKEPIIPVVFPHPGPIVVDR